MANWARSSKDVRAQDAGALKLLCVRAGLSGGPGGGGWRGTRKRGTGEGQGGAGTQNEKAHLFIGWPGELSDAGDVRSLASNVLRAHDLTL